jgi:endonuclease YncB( thermonuclease family)
MSEMLGLLLLLATVVGVVDGTTISAKLDTGETGEVKLGCIAIPDAAQQSDRSVAKQKLKQLLPNGSPIVIRIIQPHTSDGLRPTIGHRAVGEVFVDNRSVNLRLVEEGNAVVDQETIDNCNGTKTQFLIAEANAKNKRLGLWRQLNPLIKK